MDVRRPVREGLLVVAVAAFQLGGTHAAAVHQLSSRHLDVWSTLLLLAGPLVLPLRRRAPWLSIGVALAAAVGYFSAGYPGGPVFAAVIVTLIGLYRDRRGQARAWRAQEQARRRDDERLRIARELHDVLAHSTAVVSVQAKVALHLMDTHPEQVRPSLEAIRDASAESLRELRMALELLRADGESTGSVVPADREPQPGLDRLGALLASAAAAGVTVHRSTAGAPRPLRPELDLGVYRVIQESLTNAARHAGPGVVGLELHYERDALVVQVDSRGRSGAEPGPAGDPGQGGDHVRGAGSGLIGMRERAAALGGWLQAGPTEGGFRVRARLPYEVRP